MMTGRPVGLAVVGAGYWGPNLVRNAQATAGLRLEYLCDLDVERARRVLGGYSTVRASDSLDEVLADPVGERGRHCHSGGNPPADRDGRVAGGKARAGREATGGDLRRGATVGDEAQRRGLVLMLDHTYCYTPTVRHLRELVRSGHIGEVQYLDSVRINLGLVQPDVDVLWDLAPHDLSIFQAILPEGLFPVEVAAHGSDPIGAGHACVAHLTLRLSNDAIAHVHVNWLSPTKIRTMVVGGSARTAVWDDLNPSQRLSIYDRGVDRGADCGIDHGVDRDCPDKTQSIISYRIGDMVAPALPEQEALRAMMAEFASAITEQRATAH